jgi:ribonuclease HII
MAPHFELEKAAGGRVAGIDEAGRGPLAGPVVAAAVVLDKGHVPAGIDDSKKLTARRRAALFDALFECARAGTAQIGVGQASVAEIGALNILGASLLAMRRAVCALDRLPDFALVDGNQMPDLPCPARTVVKGDATSLSIAAASIIAKVTRDRIMTRLARDFPAYGWEKNAGYGTRQHREALSLVGASPHHRKGFRLFDESKLQQLSLNT